VFIIGYGMGPTSTTNGAPQGLERLEVALRLIRISCVEDDHCRELRAGAVRRVHEPREHTQIVRGVRHRLAVEAQHVRRGIERVSDQSAHDRVDWVHAVGERRRDAEVAPASAKRPEKIGVRSGVDLEHLAVRRHELDCEQVVRGEPVLAHQPAEAAAEGVAGDAGRRDQASGHSQAVLGSGGVQLSPDHAALGRGGCVVGIDCDPFHLGKVDHQATVRHGAAGDVVAASPDRDLEPRLAGDGQSRNDVVLRPAADDQGGPAVDEPVVQGASIVVLRVLRAEDGS
jgi:hypothetical protein